MNMSEFSLIAESLKHLHEKVDAIDIRLSCVETVKRLDDEKIKRRDKFLSGLIGALLAAAILKFFHLG